MNLLLFTGLSASGKSTIAREINKSLGFGFLGEREVLHTLAVARGFIHTRDWLASDGVDILLEEARSETAKMIRQQEFKNGVIIDGSYDRQLPGFLVTEFPGVNLFIIGVAVEDITRQKRMVSRLGTSLEEAQREMSLIDGFKVAAGVEEIMKQADPIIFNEGDLDVSVGELQQALRLYGLVGQSGSERLG